MLNSRYYNNESGEWCYRTRSDEDNEEGFDSLEDAVAHCRERAERLQGNQPSRAYVIAQEEDINYDNLFEGVAITMKRAGT